MKKVLAILLSALTLLKCRNIAFHASQAKGFSVAASAVIVHHRVQPLLSPFRQSSLDPWLYFGNFQVDDHEAACEF